MRQTRWPRILRDRTILITGGSSGIGLELARRLRDSNRVLICGRSRERLKQAEDSLPGIHTFTCDLSLQKERDRLFQWVLSEHADCSILINNAAIVHRTSFFADPLIMEKMDVEFQTNFLAPVALTKLFQPLLEQRPDAAIIYITTGLVYAPKAAYPAYNATKAALHSFVQGLRLQLQREDVPIRIIEVLMPAVDTPWHEGNPPKIAISVDRAVDEMLREVEKDKKEIRVAGTQAFYLVSRFAPGLALNLINRT